MSLTLALCVGVAHGEARERSRRRRLPCAADDAIQEALEFREVVIKVPTRGDDGHETVFGA